MVGLGTCLAKGELILVGWIRRDIPSALPYSKLTTLLASRSVLFPTMTQLTFWSIDLNEGKLTCSSSRTNEPRCQSFLCR